MMRAANFGANFGKGSPRSGFASCLLAVALCPSLPAASLATGFGAYFEYVHAEGEIDPGLPNSGDADFDANKYGFGFALDTNLAEDRLFNYRLNLGFQHTNRHFDDFAFQGNVFDLGHIDANGVNLNNAFGFGIWRGQNHRLWLGPSIRVAVDVYDTNDSNIDIVDVSAGGGAALGLNLHAGRNVTIGLTAGYQYLAVSEIVYIDPDSGNDDTRTFDGHEHLVTANVTIFFRTRGDQYR